MVRVYPFIELRNDVLHQILRTLRGAAGTALTWGLVWTACAVVISVLLFLVSPGLNLGSLPSAALFLGMLAGTSGVVGGAIFSSLVSTLFRGKTIGELRVGTMSAIGALAALVVPLVVVWSEGVAPSGFAFPALLIGSLGALTGGGTIAMAQEAGRHELGSGEDLERLSS